MVACNKASLHREGTGVVARLPLPCSPPLQTWAGPCLLLSLLLTTVCHHPGHSSEGLLQII